MILLTRHAKSQFLPNFFPHKKKT